MSSETNPSTVNRARRRRRAWAIYLGSPWGLPALPLYVWYVTRFQILPEEAALHRLFGASYTAYCARVRRWI